MEHFVLTKERLLNATTYMPLAQKTILSELVARKCVKPLRIVAEDKNKNETQKKLLVAPSVVGEDCDLKEMLLLNCFLSHYLDIEVEFMDANIYDTYMGSHIFNQLERVKQDKELQKIAFDILADFKIFRKMVDAEIYNLKTKENDILERLLDGFALFVAEGVTDKPDILKQIADNLKGLANSIPAEEIPKTEE